MNEMERRSIWAELDLSTLAQYRACVEVSLFSRRDFGREYSPAPDVGSMHAVYLHVGCSGPEPPLLEEPAHTFDFSEDLNSKGNEEDP